jgi:hypothetical protein
MGPAHAGPFFYIKILGKEAGKRGACRGTRASVVGRLCQTPWHYTAWSQRKLSDINGKPKVSELVRTNQTP